MGAMSSRLLGFILLCIFSLVGGFVGAAIGQSWFHTEFASLIGAFVCGGMLASVFFNMTMGEGKWKGIK
jgi:uncharacterized membrane protein YeaQ/YmgE (transglycosylase-associated protein family)